MYQQRMRVRLLEQTVGDETLVYEGEWPAVPHMGHEILIAAPGDARMLWKVDGVRHVVAVDGRCLHVDVTVRRAD